MSTEVKYDERHGGPYDRGAADAYYERHFEPHYFEGDSYASPRIPIKIGTPEYEAYLAGYREQTSTKDWG